MLDKIYYCKTYVRIVYYKQNKRSRKRNGGKYMSNEEYINKIIEMVKQIADNAILRRVYLMLVVITGADH